MLNFDMLERSADDYRRQFAEARPFPHIVFDGLYEDEALRKAVGLFPSVDEMTIRFRNSREYKTAQADLSNFDPYLKAAFDELNSDRFVEWVSYVTGIPRLLVDPTNHGGGLHQSGDGMYLDVHADFNRHAHLQWFRRLNAITYLNEGWREEYGGVLQLWDKDMRKAEASVLPAFNRTVIFATNSESFHGYDTIRVPSGMTRRSFAAYYYTEEPPTDYRGTDHTTVFRRRPGQSRRFVPQSFSRDALAWGRGAARRVMRRPAP